jgi:membrane protease YdiL (CAAX protease family)
MTPPDSAERRAWLAAALVITLTYHPFVLGLARLAWRSTPSHWLETVGDANWYRGAEFVYGLALALTTPQASGLTFGHPLRHWKLLPWVTVLPLVAIALIYPRLPVRPFVGQTVGFWLLSAPAQELVYTGFLYGRFERLYPSRIHRWLPIPWCVPVTALFFSLWHLQNFSDIAPSYVVFQLGYTFIGGVGHALIRLWTGSVLYVIAVHMAVNWIAVQA